jgi:tripartite-type tricarboxylate transporter receptor subunit TctC
MKQTVRRFGCAAIAALFACSPLAVRAQEKPANYPLRPVRIIVGIAPGGGLDSTTRLVAQMVSDKWGQTVVVDNRPGAGTVIAAELASQAPPDGYTLLMATNTLALLGAQKRVSFDVRRTFVPVAWAVTQPYVMVANPSLPVKSPKDLVAHSKAKPGTVTYGSSGVGTTLHLGMEKLAALTGASFEHVPYKGTAPALLAVIAGEIQILAGSSIATLPHVKSGKLRGLGVMGPKRIAAAPDLPTFAEALALAGFEVTNSYGLFAPAGTPAAIVDGLNRIVLAGMRTPEVMRKLQSDGAEPAEPGTPAELKVKFGRDFAEAEKQIKQLKIKFY